jgi:hypothetical protein
MFWDGTSNEKEVPEGVYFYTIIGSHTVKTGQFMLLR